MDDDSSDSMAMLERRDQARVDTEAARLRNAGKTASARVADAHSSGSGAADALTAYTRALADRRAEPPVASTTVAATPNRTLALAPPLVPPVDLATGTAAFTAQVRSDDDDDDDSVNGFVVTKLFRYLDARKLTGAGAWGGGAPQALARDVRKLVRTTQTLAEHASYLIQSRFVSGSYMGAAPVAIERQPQHESFLHTIGFETLDDERPRTLSSDDADRMHASLFVSSRAYESSMLRPPAPTEPACAAPRCKALDLVCAGGGERLVAFMSPDEWAKRASATNRSLRCLVCQRFDAMAAVARMRALNIAFRPEVLTTVARFYNITGEADEYRAEDCLLPSPHVYEGLVAPIVRYNEAGFERVINTQTGVVYFRQLCLTPAEYAKKSAAPR